MTRVWIAIAFLIALCLAMAWHTMPAKAQIACPSMKELLVNLQIRFGEFPLATADVPGSKFHAHRQPGRNFHHHPRYA